MAMPAWVSELGVAAQVVIAIMAIWGEKIRAWFGPSLRLALPKPRGQFETLAEAPDQEGRSVPQFSPARFYRLRVTNRASHPEAREVEVFLTQLDLRGPDGQPQTIYTGALPLMWQHQGHYPANRTIGRATVADVDLFFVQPGLLSLTPTVTPLNFPSKMQGGEQHFWVGVVARGVNGESNPMRLRVDWNGRWDGSDTEMAHHLIVAVERQRGRLRRIFGPASSSI
jgi:hypothetical protein